MSQDSYTQFRAVSHYGKPTITSELEVGLKSWLDWSFLRIGGWENVTTGTSGTYGGNFSILHKVHDPNYSGNTIYQGIRSDWVYETGVNYVSTTGTHDPLAVQVYVNNSGITTGTVGYQHYIDYPLGRVVFNSGVTQTVRAQYSMRAVHTYISNTLNWWFEVNYDSWNPADLQWAQNITSGDFSLSASNRIQLPAIIIEPVLRSTSTPFELGTLVNKNVQDVIIHVLGENRYERDNISDILRLQKDKTIVLPDSTLIYNSGLYPLDQRGMLVNSNAMYPNIVGNPNLLFRHALFKSIDITEVKTQHPKLHWSIVRMSVEVIY